MGGGRSLCRRATPHREALPCLGLQTPADTSLLPLIPPPPAPELKGHVVEPGTAAGLPCPGQSPQPPEPGSASKRNGHGGEMTL